MNTRKRQMGCIYDQRPRAESRGRDRHDTWPYDEGHSCYNTLLDYTTLHCPARLHFCIEQQPHLFSQEGELGLMTWNDDISRGMQTGEESGQL